ncbi:hypothetical protein ANN_22138 [Periplaneta americana]|uniref:Uncharacterized protein n=1 Tax=Periplaneta americana TaxID=6978 RepID=A0ABQ8S7S9_PERAM|nr:hypothetical protein ANN_22138 [Periplaneta americana]
MIRFEFWDAFGLNFLNLENLKCCPLYPDTFDAPSCIARETTSKEDVVQLDEAPVYFSLQVRNILSDIYPGPWIGSEGPIDWPPGSPDLTDLISSSEGKSKASFTRHQLGTKKHFSPGYLQHLMRRLRWAGYVARMGESRNAYYRMLVGRPERKIPLGRPRRRWEDTIKMDLSEVGHDDRDWVNLAQDKDRWRAYVRAAMNLRLP